MPTRTARVLAKQPTSARLEEDLRALVALAVRVTERPDQISPADVAATVGAVRSRAEYLDAVGVMIGFNFVTRVANALGVDLEVWPWMRRTESARHFTLELGARILRWLVDLRPRQLPLRPAVENLKSLAKIFAEVGLESLPEVFHQLTHAPHLLESLRELLDALLRRGGAEAKIVLDLPRFMTAGLVVLDEIRASGFREQVARWLKRRSMDLPERILERAQGGLSGRTDLESVIPRFARDVTRWSYRITPGRIGELRTCGLQDEDILDLVNSIALWNAYGRLEILVAGLPDSSE
jgi:alkylhydroperoxidase family enzyme